MNYSFKKYYGVGFFYKVEKAVCLFLCLTSSINLNNHRDGIFNLISDRGMNYGYLILKMPLCQ